MDPYNADFDGDETNIHVPQSYATLAELKYNVELSTLIVAPGASKPIIGLNMDPLLGSYLMTHEDDSVDFCDAVNMLYYTNFDLSKLDNKQKQISGKQLFSYIVPDQININRKFKIKQGLLTEGFLTKEALGSSRGSLVHLIWIMFGHNIAKDFLNNSQRLVNNWLLYRGFTVGLEDAYVDTQIMDQIKNLLETKRLEVEHLMSDVENGLNKLDLDLFENEIMGILTETSDISWKLANNFFDKIENNFSKMRISGSKGQVLNAGQISACMGQQNLDGFRVTKNFGARTLPYYHHNDDRAEARGFVRHSFLEGLDLPEFFFANIAGRNGIIDTAVKTRDTGYISRRLIKASEDLMVNYDGTIRNANGKVIQYCYAGSGMDATRLETNKLLIFRMNDSEIKETYYFTSAELNELSKIKDTEDIKEYTEKINKSYYAKIISYRDIFRQIIKTYYFGRYESITDDKYMLPFNLKRIIDNVIHIQDNNIDLKPNYVLSQINKLVNNPHICVLSMNSDELLHKEHFKKVFNKNTLFLFKVMLHTYLAPKKAISQYRLSKNQFDKIISKIILEMRKSIISPGEMVGVLSAQSIGEPSTQLTLNTFHTAGIGGVGKGISASGIPRLQEILRMTSNIKKPAMEIYLKTPFSSNEDQMKKVKYYIEEIYLQNLTNQVEIYFDPKYQYLHEDRVSNIYYVNTQTASQCTDKLNNLPWLIMIQLNRHELMQKGITLLDIRSKFCSFWTDLQDNADKEDKLIVSKISQCAILSNYDNSDIPTLHVRFSITQFHHYDIIAFQKVILEKFKIRGINGIKSTFSAKSKVMDFDSDGNITEDKEYVIYTEGSNLEDIISIRGIDFNRTITNDITNIYANLGIEAARSLLIREFDKIPWSVSYSHLSILMDIMCNKGYLVSIDRHGINRLDTDPLAKASFEETTDMLFNAAIFGETDHMTSVSSRIMAGQRILGGTGSFDILLDTNKIEEMAYEEIQTDSDIGVNLKENILMLDILKHKYTNFFRPSHV